MLKTAEILNENSQSIYKINKLEDSLRRRLFISPLKNERIKQEYLSAQKYQEKLQEIKIHRANSLYPKFVEKPTKTSQNEENIEENIGFIEKSDSERKMKVFPTKAQFLEKKPEINENLEKPVNILNMKDDSLSFPKLPDSSSKDQRLIDSDARSSTIGSLKTSNIDQFSLAFKSQTYINENSENSPKLNEIDRTSSDFLLLKKKQKVLNETPIIERSKENLISYQCHAEKIALRGGVWGLLSIAKSGICFKSIEGIRPAKKPFK